MAISSLKQLFESRTNNFNLMRLLAALAVIYGHAGAVTGHGPPDFFLQYVGYKFIGGVAVDVFFVTSGFLVAASALSGKGMKYFVMSRALRIYPALILCVALTVLVLGPLVTTSPTYWSHETWNYFRTNATALGTTYNLPGVFEQLHERAVNGSLWSLPVEVRMYLILLVVAMLGLLGRTLIFNVLFAAVLVVGIIRPEVFPGTFTIENHRHVAMMFLIGMFLWVNRARVPVSPLILAVMIGVAAYCRNTPSFGYVYGVTLPYLVLVAAFAPGLAWFNKTGDYSYGVYLYGWPSQQLALYTLGDTPNWVNTAVASALALTLAIASWHLVEKRALRLKHRFAAPRAPQPVTDAAVTS